MPVTKLISRMHGYVRFTLTEGSPERFVTLASRKGISIRDLHSTKSGFSAYVSAKSYPKLRIIARNCGCRMRIQRKFGLPFKLAKLKQRKGIVAGVVASVLLLILLSRSIWIMDIKGNNKVSDAEILFALRQQGIYAGALKSKIDLIPAEQNAILSLPNVSWLAVNIRGGRASVEVRERSVAPDMFPISTPCNIVAAEDGTIKRLTVFRGTAAVSHGDSVSAGDLLVSGITEDGEITHAIAECIAVSPVKIEKFVPFVSQEVKYTGKSLKKTTLHLLNFDIPLSFFRKMSYNKYDIMTHTEFLQFAGGSLPIGTTVTEYSEYVTEEKRISEEDAADFAKSATEKEAELKKQDAEVISESENVILLPDGALCTVKLMLQKDIALEKEILTE